MNKNSPNLYRKIIKQLASLRLAVITMCLIGVIAAVGTVVESKLGIEHAQKLVYKSWWMMGIMSLFVTNLVAVILDRWPWQKKHASFICAHIGIIFIILGQWLGSSKGLDGMLQVNIGSENKSVIVNETEVQVYSSFDAKNYTRLYRQDVDFISHKPTASKPLTFRLEDHDLKFVDYKPFVVPKREIKESEHAMDGRAVRFQIKNANVQVVEWLFQRGAQLTDQKQMGLMTVVLGPLDAGLLGRNILHLEFKNEELVGTVYRKESAEPAKRFIAKEADTVQLGWMGFELKFLRVLPQAKETWDFVEKTYPTELTVGAAKVQYKDKDYWLLRNDTMKIFSDNAVYIISYAQKRYDLSFAVKLLNFEMQKYEGLDKAREYKSLVSVPGIEQHTISMNEPLKHKGLTFYQASFQQDDAGRPVASVFSVNYDPGRWLKYIGSLIMTIGIILLFYFKRTWTWPLKKSSSP